MDTTSQQFAVLSKAVRYISNSAELMRRFEKILANTSRDQHALFFREFLCIAVEHCHMELVNVLLEDKRCELNTRFGLELNVINVALREKNLGVVETLIRAGLSVTFEDDYPEIRTDYIRRVEISVMSAIEYACRTGQPELLKVLLTCDRRQRETAHVSSETTDSRPNKRQRIDFTLGSGPMRTLKVSQVKRLTPLQVITSIAAESLSSENDLGLSSTECIEFVRVAVEIGGNVNAIQMGCTPLQMIVSEIRYINCRDPNIAEEHCKSVVEIVRILLAAGSSTRGPSNNTIVNELVSSAQFYDSYEAFDCTYLRRKCFQLRLNAELVELLLQHGAESFFNNASLRTMCIHLIYDNASHFSRECAEMRKSASLHLDHLNAITNSLADMYRCLVLSGESVKRIVPLWEDRRNFTSKFQRNFTDIAGYTSQPGRSDKLITQILCDMSVSQIVESRSEFSARRKTILDRCDEEYERVHVEKAMEWLERVDIQTTGRYSLLHLARAAIIRAMPRNVLSGVQSLGLPKLLEQFVLFKDA